MAIDLSDETRKRAIASLRRYCGEHLDSDVGDLKASLLLDFLLEEIAPSVYNSAISDAQAYVRDRLDDLEGVCHEAEFAHWPKASAARRD